MRTSQQREFGQRLTLFVYTKRFYSFYCLQKYLTTLKNIRIKKMLHWYPLCIERDFKHAETNIILIWFKTETHSVW